MPHSGPPAVTSPTSRRPGPAEWSVLGFTLVYIAASVPWIVHTGNTEFLFYVVVMVVLVGGAIAAHLRVGFSLGVLWCLSVWGLLHMAGGLLPVPRAWPIDGNVRVLYSLWLIPHGLKYDQVVHAYGFGVMTWVCWQGLRSATGAPRPTFGLLVLCVAAGMGFGALNEVIEFIATRLVPKTNVGGYENTGWDLVSNMVGASAAGWLIRLAAGRRLRP